MHPFAPVLLSQLRDCELLPQGSSAAILVGAAPPSAYMLPLDPYGPAPMTAQLYRTRTFVKVATPLMKAGSSTISNRLDLYSKQTVSTSMKNAVANVNMERSYTVMGTCSTNTKKQALTLLQQSCQA